MRMTHVAGSCAFNSATRPLASKAMARRWLVALGIFALTCAVFAPAVRGGFIMIDDPVYVVTNPLVTGGLSLDAVRRAFVTPTADLWLPVSTISHMADVTLFGLDPAGHHLTNVLLHALNAALVFLVLAGLTGAPGRSAAVALLFAIHPLRVESVAWVTERKDLLSVCFALLTIDAYRRWVRAPSAGRYLATCALYALALLSKPMVVTLPVLLLLLDVWPLARHEGWTRRILEKLPLAALAAVVSWVTIVVAGHATVSLDAVPLAARLGNAAVSCVQYLAAMAWPAGLAVYYPLPPPWPAPVVAAAAAVIVGVGFAALAVRRRAPWVVSAGPGTSSHCCRSSGSCRRACRRVPTGSRIFRRSACSWRSSGRSARSSGRARPYGAPPSRPCCSPSSASVSPRGTRSPGGGTITRSSPARSR